MLSPEYINFLFPPVGARSASPILEPSMKPATVIGGEGKNIMGHIHDMVEEARMSLLHHTKHKKETKPHSEQH